MRIALALLLMLLNSTEGQASERELACFPPRIVLEGPLARQTVVIAELEGTSARKDVTTAATLAVKDGHIARLDEDRVILPVGDGVTELLITTQDGRRLTVPIVVQNLTKTEPWSFMRHVIPVLSRTGCNMGSCHGAAAGKNGFRLSLRGYDPETDLAVLSRQVLGRRVNKTSPEESLLLLKPTGVLKHGGGVRFTSESLEYRVISEWIAEGMPRPRPDEPVLTGIEVMPSRILSQTGETQQLVVQATYSDGKVEDVTRWARYSSTDETVAKVEESGQVRVEGQGEASLTVWFSGRVQTALVTVPSSSQAKPSVFAEAARWNPIDEINLRKLSSLAIPPSPTCGDEVFLRRAYLDCTGSLPSTEKVEAFLSDRATDKRARLIEEVLRSPEYLDYWTYKWSDLFLVSSKSLAPEAMWSFSRAIRQAVADNVAWDDFARRVVTAKGSTLKDGFANYFVLHKDPIDLTESSSMAFLGMSLTCARCHNHPMEKWTQDQYYGMANLFSRVAMRDGVEKGEVIVTPAPSGEVLHPRKGVAMSPQPLDSMAAPSDFQGDRRGLFADWLASPTNPYFDRAIVNRVWKNFFGRGLIDPEDDLRASNPASDEVLMNWLVNDFRAHRRDIRHLIRTIMSSACYSRSSEPIPGNEHDFKFLSHYVPRRLPAEVLLDAISRVTEVPEAYPGYPAGWRSLQLPDAQVANSFLSSFGRPERLSTCSCERSAEPSISQALSLANGGTVNEKLKKDHGVVGRLVREKASDSQIVRTLFQSALGREPSESERKTFGQVLSEARATVGTDPEKAQIFREAIEDLYWSTLTSREFLFNH